MVLAMAPIIMATKVKPSTRRQTGCSWTALLAATTLGVAGASMIHADVRSHARLEEGRRYRLVVQSYDRGRGDAARNHDRPIASTQLAVTPAELRDGVRVGLVELQPAGERRDDRPMTLLAWVEEGKADLEFDGLRARPRPGSMTGTAPRGGSETAIQILVAETLS
jgi:hypothetical protein